MTKNENLLPSTDHPGWTGGGLYGDPANNPVEIAARRNELNAARAHIGMQPVTDEQWAALTVPPAAVEDTRQRLEALSKLNPGPSPETLAELARIQGERTAARAALHSRLHEELKPIHERARQARQEVERIAKEYAPVLVEMSKVPDENYLKALPDTETSYTLVQHLSENIAGVLESFTDVPRSLMKQAEVLQYTVSQIAGTSITPQERADLLRERDALQNLTELPASLLNRIKVVVRLREAIEFQSREFGALAVKTAGLPEIEQSANGRTAMAKKFAAGR